MLTKVGFLDDSKKTMETNKHWKNNVKVFLNVLPVDVEKTLNEFYENKFVIATQIKPKDVGIARTFDLIVYYKTAPKK